MIEEIFHDKDDPIYPYIVLMAKEYNLDEEISIEKDSETVINKNCKRIGHIRDRLEKFIRKKSRN